MSTFNRDRSESMQVMIDANGELQERVADLRTKLDSKDAAIKTLKEQIAKLDAERDERRQLVAYLATLADDNSKLAEQRQERIAELEAERAEAFQFILRNADPFQLSPLDGDYYDMLRNKALEGEK